MLSTNNDSLLTVAVTTIMPEQQYHNHHHHYHNHAAISTEAEADADADAEAHATILPQTPAESSLFELHLLAQQRLNNKGAEFLITGNYDEGIVVLTKALKLIEQYSNLAIASSPSSSSSSSSTSSVSPLSPPSCHYCSLESCLSTIDSDYEHDRQDDSSRSTAITTTEDIDDNSNINVNNNNESNNNWFVYRRPLFVHKKCIEGKHNMGGTTLSILILFNLALAHHLKAIDTIIANARSERSAIGTANNTSTSASNTNTNTNTNKLLYQALQLYELAYQLHIDNNNNNNNDNNEVQLQCQHQTTQSTSSSSSVLYCTLRFTMIISNNLGDIHRNVAGNKQKHIMCLQHLLSALMYIVDNSKSINTTNTTTTTTINNNNSNTNINNLSANNNGSILSEEMMDGFIYNVSPIIFGVGGSGGDHNNNNSNNNSNNNTSYNINICAQAA